MPEKMYLQVLNEQGEVVIFEIEGKISRRGRYKDLETAKNTLGGKIISVDELANM